MENINDETVAEMLLCLMELSATTYMKNKVVFSEAEIESLRCPIPLEETGFLSKYSSNFTEPKFQFRHLILHEYFTGLYISVTKDITPFFENRELSSCKPTILGIQRMLKMEENELFLALYSQLQTIYNLKSKKSEGFFSKVSRKLKKPKKAKKMFDEFVGEFLKIPSTMIKNGDTLLIHTGKNDYVEFLTLYKESRDNLIPTPFVTAARSRPPA